MAFDADARLVELAQGVFIEEDVLGVVRAIQAYDENLVVQYLDPNQHSDITDAPYRIMEKCPDGHYRLVFSVWELDNRVLDRLHAADTQKHDILGRVDRSNNSVKLGWEKRYRAEIEAVSEMMSDVLRSPKDTYTAKNPVTGEDHKFTSLPRE